jgi:predicted Rossmann-fold nucleotide-binding protein
MICWSQLGIHRKAVGLVNTLGYYDHLLAQLKHGVDTGFIKERYAAVWCADSEPRALLDRLEASAAEVPEGLINTWRPFPAGLAAQVELEELEAYDGFAK